MPFQLVQILHNYAHIIYASESYKMEIISRGLAVFETSWITDLTQKFKLISEANIILFYLTFSFTWKIQQVEINIIGEEITL